MAESSENAEGEYREVIFDRTNQAPSRETSRPDCFEESSENADGEYREVIFDRTNQAPSRETSRPDCFEESSENAKGEYREVIFDRTNQAPSRETNRLYVAPPSKELTASSEVDNGSDYIHRSRLQEQQDAELMARLVPNLNANGA